MDLAVLLAHIYCCHFVFCTFRDLTQKFRSPHSACPDPSVKNAVGEEGIEAVAEEGVAGYRRHEVGHQMALLCSSTE